MVDRNDKQINFEHRIQVVFLEKNEIQYRNFLIEDKQDFIDINVEWLRHFDLLEPADMISLENPEKEVLEPGGEIFIAMDLQTHQMVGTCVLLPTSTEGVFELAKFCVHQSQRGKGIGRHLIEIAIDFASKRKFQKIVLSSNAQLKAALHLYESFGFYYLKGPLDDLTPYQTANIFMEKLLQK